MQLEVDGAAAPMFSQGHLAAIALETNRLKDKLRLWQFLGSSSFDQRRFDELVRRFGLQELWTGTQALC